MCFSKLFFYKFVGTIALATNACVTIAQYDFTAWFTNENILVDGHLTDSSWRYAPVLTDFQQNFPYDTLKAISQTRVRVLYNQEFLFVGAECLDNQPEKDYVITSLRRDFSGSDLFEVYIDAFADGTNGFAFGVSPLGVQREGQIFDGSRVNWDWDGKWYSFTQPQPYGWSVEMAIPLKTIRFPEGATFFHINFVRFDFKRNEKSTWVPIPRIYVMSNCAFMGKMSFEKPLYKKGTNISFIPYLTGGYAKNYLPSETKNFSKGTGLDAKMAVSSSLNLDFTINPDFSQVEVDRQVINLTQFEIYFPERRLFFLENSDLFARFGFSRIRPFFSRRIGVGRDPNTGQFQQNTILYGARLSGRIDAQWRIGLMNMVTAPEIALKIPATSYTVAAVQRQIFKRSNIACIVVSKDNMQDSAFDWKPFQQYYNRVVGVDYNLQSKDNRWTGKIFVHRSFVPFRSPHAWAHATYLDFTDNQKTLQWNHEYVHRDYRAEVGFVPGNVVRGTFWRIQPLGRWYFYPKSKFINRIGPTWGWDSHHNQDFTKWYDSNAELGIYTYLQNAGDITLQVRFDRYYLFRDFDPSGRGGKTFPKNTFYHNWTWIFRFNSNPRLKFSYGASYQQGGYYIGTIQTFSFYLSKRIQPYGNVGLECSSNRIRLPEPFYDANLFLITPTIYWAFTKSFFMSVVFQYNNQIQNINTNIRLQWRFKPLSDLFIVYTDNYTDNFVIKNRGVVCKLSYWL
ncbi:MAG: carbohydrate binding family 9 domain-containing protein [Cytophagales bacterium]|nr:carbohydrate binding family 9 domain-containing protein [Cytophagales bacterium]MDW8384350.1 DUF5916 domain-containing protein [Flammeovirgaceae bacterium]